MRHTSVGCMVCPSHLDRSFLSGPKQCAVCAAFHIKHVIAFHHTGLVWFNCVSFALGVQCQLRLPPV